MAEMTLESEEPAAFRHLSHTGLLKPTAVFGLLEAIIPAAWLRLAGQSRAEYFAAHPVRPVFTHLRIERRPQAVEIDAPVQLRLRGTFGHYAGRDGERRYGFRDLLDISTADGEPVLRWTAHALWMRMGEDGITGLLTKPAPSLLLSQDDEIAAPPQRPRVEAAEAGSFRWTPRETDINRHVFFRAYLERAENALADAGHDTETLRTWDLWFQRPTFLGQRMVIATGATDEGGQVVELRDEAGAPCCTVQAREGQA